MMKKKLLVIFERVLNYIPDFPGVSWLFSKSKPTENFVDLKDIQLGKTGSPAIGYVLLSLTVFLACFLLIINQRLSYAQKQIQKIREQHVRYQHNIGGGDGVDRAENMGTGTLSSEESLKSSYIILVLGTEQDRRSDTIMLCHVFLDRAELRILSLPRDTRVLMNHHDEIVLDKIGHAYRFGGVEQVIHVLEMFLGLNIDFHYVIDLAIFKKIIDAIGGVEIDVLQDLRYEDRAGGLSIDISKGRQVLNGKDAEGFVRYREEKDGDLGRIGRQQQFIKSFSRKISSLKEFNWQNIRLIGRLPGFVVDLFRDIDTDMSVDFFLKLYMGFSDRGFSDINIKNTTLGGEGEYLRDFTNNKWVSYYISTRRDRYQATSWLLDKPVGEIVIEDEELANLPEVGTGGEEDKEAKGTVGKATEAAAAVGTVGEAKGEAKGTGNLADNLFVMDSKAIVKENLMENDNILTNFADGAVKTELETSSLLIKNSIEQGFIVTYAAVKNLAMTGSTITSIVVTNLTAINSVVVSSTASLMFTSLVTMDSAIVSSVRKDSIETSLAITTLVDMDSPTDGIIADTVGNSGSVVKSISNIRLTSDAQNNNQINMRDDEIIIDTKSLEIDGSTLFVPESYLKEVMASSPELSFIKVKP